MSDATDLIQAPKALELFSLALQRQVDEIQTEIARLDHSRHIKESLLSHARHDVLRQHCTRSWASPSPGIETVRVEATISSEGWHVTVMIKGVPLHTTRGCNVAVLHPLCTGTTRAEMSREVDGTLRARAKLLLSSEHQAAAWSVPAHVYVLLSIPDDDGVPLAMHAGSVSLDMDRWIAALAEGEHAEQQPETHFEHCASISILRKQGDLDVYDMLRRKLPPTRLACSHGDAAPTRWLFGAAALIEVRRQEEEERGGGGGGEESDDAFEVVVSARDPALLSVLRQQIETAFEQDAGQRAFVITNSKTQMWEARASLDSALEAVVNETDAVASWIGALLADQTNVCTDAGDVPMLQDGRRRTFASEAQRDAVKAMIDCDIKAARALDELSALCP
jgi:hypothetical protein